MLEATEKEELARRVDAAHQHHLRVRSARNKALAEYTRLQSECDAAFTEYTEAFNRYWDTCVSCQQNADNS
jgi:hypothetical protein